MDLQKLKTFRTVALLLNFNSAAKVLNYAQSTVSAQIKALEEEIGVPLFERSAKQVALNAAGMKLLNYSDKLLAMEAEAIADVASAPHTTGKLSIRAPESVSTYLMPDVLSMFLTRYPQVRFDFSNCTIANLVHELQIGVVDLAVLLVEYAQATPLNTEFLRTEPLVVVAGPDHPLVDQLDLDFGDLAQQTILLPKEDCGYRISFEQGLAAEHAVPKTILEFNSIEAIKRCVAMGLGITIIPEIAVKAELEQQKLCRLSWNTELEVAVMLVWSGDPQKRTILHVLMDTIRQVLRD